METSIRVWFHTKTSSSRAVSTEFDRPPKIRGVTREPCLESKAEDVFRKNSTQLVKEKNQKREHVSCNERKSLLLKSP